MRPLKKRLRPDNIPSERRIMRRHAGRTIYLFLLVVFAFAVAKYLFGDFLLLEADGLVLRDQHVVATTYIARVQTVDVKEGQPVQAGDVLLKLQSTELLERLADLSTKRAELVARVTDFKVRSASVVTLLPLAERRETESLRTIEQFDNLAEEKLVTSARYQEALRSNYEASRDRVSLTSQMSVLKEELSALDSALADADDALTDLQGLYSNGVVRSPVSGSIGAAIPMVGNVYRPGDPILSVYYGDPYVLVYLPRRYLFPIYVGMDVRLSDGRESAEGMITEILPVTDALPKEFQNTFQPLNRSQLAKITLAVPLSFPLNQKVSVSRYPNILSELRKATDYLGSMIPKWGNRGEPKIS